MNGGGSRPIVEPVPDGQGTTWSYLMLPIRQESSCLSGRGCVPPIAPRNRREVSSLAARGVDQGSVG